MTIEETNTLPTQTFGTDGHPPAGEGTTEPSSNKKDVTPLIAGVVAGMLVLVVVLTVIVLALGIFIKTSKKSVANRNIKMKENAAHVANKDIMTAANDCYAHSAEMKENSAYALPSNIDTSINESYATNTNMAANPAYGTHDSTYAAIAEPEDKHTTSQPEYDYVINRRT